MAKTEEKNIQNDELTTIMNNMVELCRESEKGITEKMLQIAMSGVSPLVRADAVNKLLGMGRIEICKQGLQLLYRIKEHNKTKGSDDEEKIVYSIIEKAGNKGIWIRDIRFQSNLSQTQLNKVLKNMESQKLIKSVKSVAASKKKVYMLNEIEPDRSVTGGSWYSGNDYESEFIEVLGQQCLRFLLEKSNIAKQNNQSNPLSRRNTSFVASTDVWKFIKDVGISKVELSVDDIESILDTLVFDGKVEKHITALNNSETSNKLYRSIESLGKDTGFMRMPCGLCPVYNDCYEGGPICPSKCIYIKDWFEM